MITTIIFDIGMVLAEFAWEEYIASFGFSKEVEKRLAKATVMAPVWDEFDRGEMTDEQIIQAFIENDPGIEKEIRQITEDVHDIVTPYDYAIPWVDDLKAAGYRVLYLSNFSQKARVECAYALGFMSHMDGGIMSYEIKKIKPEPAIYQELIDRYDLIPEECVFLDDRKVNTDAAEVFGIHTITFTNQADAIEALKKLGVSTQA